MACLRQALYALAGLSVLMASNAIAVERRPVEWGFFLSGGGAQSFLNPNEQPWALGYDFRLGWDLRFDPDWRLAVFAGRRRFFNDTTTTSVFKFPDPKAKSSQVWSGTVFNVSARRVLLTPRRPLRPYILAGFGLTGWQVKDYAADTLLRVPGDDDKLKDYQANEWHLNLGLGAEYELSHWIAARAGLDFFYLTGWGTSFAESIDDYRTRGNLVFSLGFTVYLGAGKERQPPGTPLERPELIVGKTLPAAGDADSTIAPQRDEAGQKELTAAKGKSKPTKYDTDGDGVADSTDLCPGTPVGLPVDVFGCPLDTDGDGVIDPNDQCNATPSGAFVDSAGCPTDSDGDGVYDGLDFCPDTPRRWCAQVDKHGCVGDDDADGVPNFLDHCPESGPGDEVDSSGCVPDEDSDGVPDALDLCSGTPSGLAVDETGCLVMTQLTRKLLIFPDFEPGLVTLDRISRQILNDLAIRLAAAPRLKVFIRAYTDNIGEAEANRNISQRRADKARQYLVDRGIAPGRITAVGLGEVDFIADNSTAAGRKRNRRLEITYEH